MESMSQKQARGRLELPTRQALGEGNRVRRNNQVVSIPPRPRSTCTCSNRPGSVRCSKHGYMVPGDKLIRRHQANKEILRRALAPPNRRFEIEAAIGMVGFEIVFHLGGQAFLHICLPGETLDRELEEASTVASDIRASDFSFE
ncbi:hypothetical protein POTOM_039912 [Populus tomentosa]|uniref:Uncharacterized protein n=1 Tax=Populus tomentosa TaxID=118781 RepID=A0A8X7YXR2_POPTO|nr:hypothetical protein POTOM_039912 [Populus tomentosa]